MGLFSQNKMDIKSEIMLHEKDALTNIQLEQTKGITGFFYRMYIDDSRRFAEKFSGKRILDIGAGDGMILGDSLLNPIEIDISLERCRRLKEKQHKVLCANGFALPIKDNSVDCVLLIAILEHTSSPRKVLNEIYRVLKRGGETAILVPNDINMSLGRLMLLKFPPRYPGHISFITPAKLKKWASGKFEITGSYNLPFHRINFWFSLYHFIYLKKL
jgi:SAM-dependent methyltransferase